jgi:hypothetical protein
MYAGRRSSSLPPSHGGHGLKQRALAIGAAVGDRTVQLYCAHLYLYLDQRDSWRELALKALKDGDHVFHGGVPDRVLIVCGNEVLDEFVPEEA